MSSIWVVESKGDHKKGSWELSVVKKGCHGEISWGWYGEDKIRISDSGGPYKHPIPTTVFKANVKVAESIAERLNNGESYGDVMNN